MLGYIILVLAGVVVVAVAGGVLLKKWRLTRGESQLERAKRTFQLRREWLEARFLTLAQRSGRPRGLIWTDCEFENPVSFARDRSTGQLRALVGVTIQFEAEEGGGMEDNPNVGNLRAATAVFRFDRGEWTTDGRAIFNLNPSQAIRHFESELERAD